MRPDPETNNAALYCLAESAQRFGIGIIDATIESNHHHSVLHDQLENVSSFTGRYHSLFALCQNRLRGRKENFWSTDEPSIVLLADWWAVVESVVYGATNPVKDGLVDRAHHWPGLRTLPALLKQRTMTARRPAHFFNKDGPMPETATLELKVPAELGDPQVFLKAVEEGVARVEETHGRERRETGQSVLGRRRILRQSWRDSPESAREPKRRERSEIRPRFKTRDPELREQLVTRRQIFLRDYRLARIAWLAGTPIPFPRGTYWLRRFVGVPIVSVSN